MKPRGNGSQRQEAVVVANQLACAHSRLHGALYGAPPSLGFESIRSYLFGLFPACSILFAKFVNARTASPRDVHRSADNTGLGEGFEKSLLTLSG
jgi:hypothetical protein